MPTMQPVESSRTTDVDVIVVGGGFSGIHTLHKLVRAGLSTWLLEARSDIGGVWHRNTYPGARTDSESWVFSYAFDEVVHEQWDWSELFPTQPEILAYLRFAVRKLRLRPFIRLSTRADSASYDENTRTWTVRTSQGDALRCAYLVIAAGSAAVPVEPDLPGLNTFRGLTCTIAHWPAAGVDFAGRRVVVVGTGSAGVQMIPIIARAAAHLLVVQRAARYVVPSHNHVVSQAKSNKLRSAYDQVLAGRGFIPGAVDVGEAAATKTPEPDVRDLIRDSIRAIVKNPATAEMLCPGVRTTPEDHLLLGHFYYETFNRNNVDLVDVSRGAVAEVTPTGVCIDGAVHEADILITTSDSEAKGSVIAGLDIRGRGGVPFQDVRIGGSRTHLGTATDSFPNMFMISGPQIPFANAPVVSARVATWLGEVIKSVRFPIVEVGGIHASGVSRRRRQAHRSGCRPQACRPRTRVPVFLHPSFAATLSPGSDGA